MTSRMTSFMVVLCLCFSCWPFCILVANAQQQQKSERKPSVAIVGAGIGGSSTSFFLRELLGERVQIEVFDKSNTPGGRADHFMYEGKAFETGASIIYSGNRYLFNLTELVGLKRVDPAVREGSGTGIWDGERFVLVTTRFGLLNLLKMLWRYGRSLFSLNSMVGDALKKFDRIYELQEAGKVFHGPGGLWGEVGLLDLTKISIAEYIGMRMGKRGSLIKRELSHAANRVNYNQGNELNALAGVVSLCPAVTGDLFKVEGGNSRLAEELLRKSATNLRLETRITEVRGSLKNGYSLYGADREQLGTFDAVIIAAPLVLADIALDVRKEDGTAEQLLQPLQVVKYQEVHTTFVKGEVNRAFFGVGPGQSMPPTVMLAEGAVDSFFSSLALYQWIGDPADRIGLYKVFSRQELWTGALDSLFVAGSWEVLHHREWRAYPVHAPTEAFSPAMLFQDQPVWYVNSLEEGVSAMEIAAISAKNAALGVANSLSRAQESRSLRQQGQGAATAAADGFGDGEF